MSEQPPLYAGFWRRVAAFSIDTLITIIAAIALGVVLAQHLIIARLLSVIVVWLYYALFHSSEIQATPGKAVFHIKVTDVQGQRISFSRATGRHFATWISSLLLMGGYVMAAFTKKKQALHDQIAGTLVVDRGATPTEIEAGGGVMRVTAGVWLAVVLFLVVPFGGGLVAGILMPAYQDYAVRAKVAAAYAQGDAVKAEVESMMARGELPPAGTSKTMKAGSPTMDKMTIESDGRIVMALKDIDAAPSGRILLAPHQGSGSVTWRCSGEEVPGKYLPRACQR